MYFHPLRSTEIRALQSMKEALPLYVVKCPSASRNHSQQILISGSISAVFAGQLLDFVVVVVVVVLQFSEYIFFLINNLHQI